MNSSVLRGFCQCGRPVIYDGTALHYHYEGNELIVEPPDKKHIPLVQYVLSPQQMKIVIRSKQFEKWVNQNKFSEVDSLQMFFEESPFLVAKILKEASS